MKVRDLLKGKDGRAITVAPQTEVATAVALLMYHKIGGVPVVAAGDEVVGFLSERDIVTAMHKHGAEAGKLRVEQVMRSPAPICGLDNSLNEAMAQMTRGRWRHLVVLDGKTIAGILSLGDIVKQRLEAAELEAGVLRDYVAAQRAR